MYLGRITWFKIHLLRDPTQQNAELFGRRIGDICYLMKADIRNFGILFSSSLQCCQHLSY